MGFLDFLKKEKKPDVVETAPEETVKVGIDELGDWFQKKFKEVIEKSKSEGASLYDSINDSFLEVRNSFIALESARFPGKERVHAAANMIKDSFVKKAYPILANMEKTSKETDMSYSGFNSFIDEATKTLESLKKTTPKQAVLISRYFKKQSDPIVANMKKTEDSISALRKWLNEDVMFRTLSQIENKTKEQLSDLEDMKSLEKKKEETKKEIKTITDKKQEKESEYLELLKGKEWGEFNTLSKDLKNVKSEILKIEYELTNELSPMKRPLKKLEHTLKKQDIMFNHRGFLKGFIQDPFGAVKTKNGEDTLRRFLFTMNKMLHDKKIDLKDKEREKLDSLLERMVREVPEMKKKYSELTETRERMKKTLKESSKILNKKQELESEIEKYSKYISEMEEEIKDVLKEQNKLKEKIENERKELEKLILKKTGVEVDIAA